MFNKENFENEFICFKVYCKPPSVHSKSEQKEYFRKTIHKITSQSEYIISGYCHVSIDYRCGLLTRKKNPGIYDIDNIIKPILDSIVGADGIIVDDTFFNRVTVNWQDTEDEEHFEIEIGYSPLMYDRKSDLIYIKSPSGWCFPTTNYAIENTKYIKIIRSFLSKWDSIKSIEEFYKVGREIPMSQFIYHSKLSGKDFKIIDIEQIC